MLLTEFFTEDVAIANMITTMDGGNITNEMETSELSDILSISYLSSYHYPCISHYYFIFILCCKHYIILLY